MLTKWEVIVGLVITLNLFNFIWLTHIRYKRTIARRRKRWKRWLSILFFVLAPIVFVLNLLNFALVNWFNLALGLIGTWFGFSQLRFISRHSGVPQIVEPMSTFYVLVAGMLSLIGALKIM